MHRGLWFSFESLHAILNEFGEIDVVLLCECEPVIRWRGMNECSPTFWKRNRDSVSVEPNLIGSEGGLCTIQFVSDDGMSEVSEVNPYLMHSACVGEGFNHTEFWCGQ